MVTTTSVFSALSTPAYSNSGDQKVIVSGRIQPAAAGRSVSLYSENSDGTTNAYVTGATTDANGYFSMTTTVTVVTNYHLYSGKQVVGADTYTSAITSSFQIRSLRLWDDFSYANTDALLASGRWALRNPNYGDGGRNYCKADVRAIEVSGGQLKLKVVADPDAPGKFLIGQITTGMFPVVNGHFEAKIKFHRPLGAHAAFWHQGGYDPGEAELDIVEFFGERGPEKAAPADVWSQKVQHTVHVGDGAGGIESYSRNSWTTANPWTTPPGTANVQPDDNDAWWTEFHTFEALWHPTSGYTFYVDGVNVGKVGAPIATQPGEVILSQLISDGGEYNNLMESLDSGLYTTSDYTMTVDWVRVWR